MNSTAVANKASIEKPMVGCRYPADRVALLDAIRARCGDKYMSDTVRRALDELVEQHFPGATGEAA